MNEIELKAHVLNRRETENKLNSFAQFKSTVTKDDVYYFNPAISEKSIRIRKETENENCRYLLTYKQKEKRTNESGHTIEVNNEKECTLSCAEPLESYFADCGFSVKLKKHKEVSSWVYSINGFDCTIELCNVPPLGDFVELEILSKKDDDETVSQARNALYEILYLCGIDKSCIENRYYSELLKSVQGENNV